MQCRINRKVQCRIKCQSRLQQMTVINIFSLFFRENKLDVSSDSSARSESCLAEDSHKKSSLIFF